MNYRPYALLASVVLAWGWAMAQSERIQAQISLDLTPLDQPQTLTRARQDQYATQANLIARDRFDLQRYPLGEVTEKQWKQTLWATGVLEPKADYVAQSLGAILELTRDRNLNPSQWATVQRALQVATQLYQSDPVFYQAIGDQFEQMLTLSPYSAWVAMALTAKIQAGMPKDKGQQALNLVKSRFPWAGDLPLQVALRDIEERLNPAPLPPLKDWLNWQITPNQAQLYVFCRPDRSILCTAVFKDRQGRWLRENARSDSPLWSVPLLTRSLHQLRWHFTRGDTPQGIYRLEGTMPRSPSNEFRAYGQFPLVKLFMPLEAGVKTFVPPNIMQLTPNIASYQSLLPPTWRDYFPIQGTFWAGQLGRSLIRIHGSGEDLSFFAGNQRFQDSYGWNPAIGCLSAAEVYDVQTGRLKRADMPKILTVLSQGQGLLEGFAIVIEVPTSDQQPLSVSEIEANLPGKALPVPLKVTP